MRPWFFCLFVFLKGLVWSLGTSLLGKVHCRFQSLKDPASSDNVNELGPDTP